MLVHPDSVAVNRRVFCNRTLNLRSISVIGYDMDYTLVHYNVEEWEGRAYAHMKQRLLEMDWPVAPLEFDKTLVERGLIIDVETGNVVKANRFGYIKMAKHGTQTLEFSKLRKTYARTVIDLSEDRWVFLNTLFSISEACMYAQMVDLLDDGQLPNGIGYRELYSTIRNALDQAHIEGELKREIMSDPERFVELDADTPLTLLDQRKAGKKVILITNSEWEYTKFMMEYAFDPYLPGDMKWRDLFHLVVVSARKPAFFMNRPPIFQVVNDDGLLKPNVGKLQIGGTYLGGHARLVEECFGVDGERILYIGDHIYGDVSVSKSILRWRTALVLREMEREMDTIELDKANSQKIRDMMAQKEALEHEFSEHRLDLLRIKNDYGEHTDADPEVLKKKMADLRTQLQQLDVQIGALVSEDGRTSNPHWGLLMRAGNDKSHLTRQVERYADVYTSRVSNFLGYTPFMYFRSPRGSLPHDPGSARG